MVPKHVGRHNPSRSRASAATHETKGGPTSSMAVQGWPTGDRTEREPGDQTPRSTPL